MSAVVADTHTVIWYLLSRENLSANAIVALEQATAAGDPIYVASISVVEVIYLVERRRLPELALERLIRALSEVDTVVIVPLDLGVAQAMQGIPRDVVPDMPDRIIAATALYLNLPLVTRDSKIRSSAMASPAAGIATIW